MINSVETQAFIKKIAERPLKKNTNFLCSVVGLSGTGKSYACMRMGELITQEINKSNLKEGLPPIPFGVENIVFSPQEFMKAIHGETAFPACSVIIYEEVGVTLDSKNSLGKLNKMIAHVVETMRYRKYITFFNLPRFMNLDKTVRLLCHCIIETMGIDKKRCTNRIKPLFTSYNPKQDKTYFLYMRYRNKASFPTKIKNVSLKKPSVILQHRYEKKKHEFADKLYTEILSEMSPSNDFESKDKEEVLEEKKQKEIDSLNFIQKKIYDQIVTNPTENFINLISKIKDEYGFQSVSINSAFKTLKKKGLIQY